MKFTDSHEWIEMESSNVGIVGISNHAQEELGDIVYVELPVVGKKVKASQEAAVLESTKAAADVYAPLSGTIVEVNIVLKTNPELINRSAEKEGWLYKIRLDNLSELDHLMDSVTYHAMFKKT
jgi:glycine cleavage system H protein